MQGKTKETSLEFCEQAAVEQDPDKLLQLVNEINRMLEEKETRLQRAKTEREAKKQVSERYPPKLQVCFLHY